MTDKYSLLNVTAIINMVYEAKISMWSDTEETARILNELMEILETTEDFNRLLKQPLIQRNE